MKTEACHSRVGGNPEKNNISGFLLSQETLDSAFPTFVRTGKCGMTER